MALGVSLLGGFFVFLLVLTATKMRRFLPSYQLQQRIRSLGDPVDAPPPERKGSRFAALRDLSEASFYSRAIEPIVKRVQAFFLRLAPAGIYRTVQDYIVLAGKQGAWNVPTIIACWGLVIVGAVLLMLLVVSTSNLLFIQRLMLLAIGVVLGAMLPLSVLKSKVRERKERIVRQLPEFLDLLCVSVQAGLSIDGALAHILARMKGPLIDEFLRMQRDCRIGIPRRDAMHQMAKRCDVEEVYLFVTSVIQAERLGTSMGKTLVDQANNIRDRHQQRIRAKALKAPIKILFPLVLFIFPVLFIIILVPPLITILNTLHITGW